MIEAFYPTIDTALDSIMKQFDWEPSVGFLSKSMIHDYLSILDFGVFRGKVIVRFLEYVLQCEGIIGSVNVLSTGAKRLSDPVAQWVAAWGLIFDWCLLAPTESTLICDMTGYRGYGQD